MTSRLVFYDPVPFSFLSNQSLHQGHKCTPQAPLDTHLRDKYLVTQSITAPRQRGGQAKTSGHQRLISHQRDNNCFSWSESYSDSKAHSLCMSRLYHQHIYFRQLQIPVVSDLGCLPWQEQVMNVQNFLSFFLQASRSFLFWAGCPSSRPPYPSPLRDTLAVPSSLSRWSSKIHIIRKYYIGRIF